MKKNVFLWSTPVCHGLVCMLMAFFMTSWARAEGYDKVMERGTLRHLGVPYAHFVSGSGDGFSVELVQMFADYLGVRYEYVNASWASVISDLIGKKTTVSTQKLSTGEPADIKGDLIANGLTILPWREREILFSVPIFPSGVWIVARADFPHQPIVPSDDLAHDIQSTIDRVKGYRVLAIEGGCLDPALNRLEGSGVNVKIMPAKMNLNELIPAVLNNEADCTLLDFPDALVGIQKWPGKVKILGPVSMNQYMGVGFAKSSVRLRDEFNLFFQKCVNEGKYARLVNKYYPAVFSFYPSFFEGVMRICEK
ncbi:transporter substrate-binding domain-containing protein [Desulforapulum autotrophicum]|jgi:ABC-type amino acid transport substrate-binding protein|nr:transporter substrate-binding domain-containing protein [Desulforapulum autotrophicum]